jgi:hypothetical protein
MISIDFQTISGYTQGYTDDCKIIATVANLAMSKYENARHSYK